MKYIARMMTPLHIGTGETITPYDSFLHDGRLVIYNLSTLFAENPNRAEQFAARVNADPRNFSLQTFLSPAEKKNSAAWHYSTQVQRYAKNPLRRQEVRAAVKDPYSNSPVIPGSSLKGALRTAVLMKIIRENYQAGRELYQKVMREGDKFLSELLRGKEDDAKYDYLRAVSVSDSFPPSEGTSSWVVYVQKVLSASISADDKPGKRGELYSAYFKNFITLLECIRAGTRLHGTICFDHNAFEPLSSKVLGWKPHHIPITTEYIISAANEFSKEVCQWELNYFEKLESTYHQILQLYRDLLNKLNTPPPSTCFLCLGWGSGWHKATIGLAIQRVGERKELDKFREKFKLVHGKRENLRRYLRFQYPKSRKLLMLDENQPGAPPGWVELKIVEDEELTDE